MAGKNFESFPKCTETITLARDILNKNGLKEGVHYFVKKGEPSSNGKPRNWSFALSQNKITGKLGPVFFRIRPEQTTPVYVPNGKVFLEYFDPPKNMPTNSCAPLIGIGGTKDNYVFREIDIASHSYSQEEIRLFTEELLVAHSKRKGQTSRLPKPRSG